LISNNARLPSQNYFQDAKELATRDFESDLRFLVKGKAPLWLKTKVANFAFEHSLKQIGHPAVEYFDLPECL
jgi:hypothetical protein